MHITKNLVGDRTALNADVVILHHLDSIRAKSKTKAMANSLRAE